MERDEAFRRELAAAGFQEVVAVERVPGEFLAEHAHPFEAMALIVDGEIATRTRDRTALYRNGDVLDLAAGPEHQETYGPTRVPHRVGRI